ncbi:DNA/RNA nuclease SfsA [Thiolapillus brandeum]|uniref:Sugar fermentation stimulation protein homolog n=1 Tax=Thiolapillus brandeum TaxID=1076588 RepID=A0A7U6GKI4_9GAMM|nr:DNA/RNA nuclease SfsA [Thiolapillus brandeum]BAO45290.1 sugar fermentation stimulation protein [Thiolapillus brandeum]
MKLPPLTNGHILRRYKRFLADVELGNGELVVAHVPNTGRMTGCWVPGAPVQLSRSDNPRRKLAWTLERVDMGQGWVGVNTQRTNPVVAEGFHEQRVPGLEMYGKITREVKTGQNSRLDFRLQQEGFPDAWVEVKNVTLLESECLAFPDARSERGCRHLMELSALRQQGCRAVILYALNRPEGRCFRPADQVDAEYGQLLRQVVRQGVEVLALRLVHTDTGIVVGEKVEIDLSVAG